MTPDGPGTVVRIEQQSGTLVLGRRLAPFAWVTVDLENDGRRLRYSSLVLEPLQEWPA